jgi:predicted lipid-binding transport protein (Tim44 family)
MGLAMIFLKLIFILALIVLPLIILASGLLELKPQRKQAADHQPAQAVVQVLVRSSPQQTQKTTVQEQPAEAQPQPVEVPVEQGTVLLGHSKPQLSRLERILELAISRRLHLRPPCQDTPTR